MRAQPPTPPHPRPPEFERHCGLGGYKKWRCSIKVDEPGVRDAAQLQGIGAWMAERGHACKTTPARPSPHAGGATPGGRPSGAPKAKRGGGGGGGGGDVGAGVPEPLKPLLRRLLSPEVRRAQCWC